MPEVIAGTAREHIERFWPEHAKHLSPPGSRLGSGHIDPDEGVVCNCGEVLGFPKVQDEADYVLAESDQPDISGAQSGEPDDEPDRDNYDAHTEPPPGVDEATPDEAGWNYLMVSGDEAQAVPHDTSDEYHEDEPHDGKGEIQGQPHHFEAPLDPWDPGWVEGQQTAPPKGVMPSRPPDVIPAEDPIAARVVVIDPTAPYTQVDVEHQLIDITGRIERGVHFQRYWEEREYIASAAYTQKAARVRLQDTSGAKDIRDARVQVECQEEWAELEMCRTMVRAVRETMHNLRSLQSGYQTVSRSVSESMRVPRGSRNTP